jgi:hypothetical protein
MPWEGARCGSGVRQQRPSAVRLAPLRTELERSLRLREPGPPSAGTVVEYRARRRAARPKNCASTCASACPRPHPARAAGPIRSRRKRAVNWRPSDRAHRKAFSGLVGRPEASPPRSARGASRTAYPRPRVLDRRSGSAWRRTSSRRRPSAPDNRGLRPRPSVTAWSETSGCSWPNRWRHGYLRPVADVAVLRRSEP